MKFKINNSNWEIKEISNSEMNMMESSDLKDTFTHGTTQYDKNIIYLNKESANKRRTLYHELTHCFMYEFGHNQHEKEFNHEDVCEICACSHDLIHEIAEQYFNGTEVTMSIEINSDMIKKSLGIE